MTAYDDWYEAMLMRSQIWRDLEPILHRAKARAKESLDELLTPSDQHATLAPGATSAPKNRQT